MIRRASVGHCTLASARSTYSYRCERFISFGVSKVLDGMGCHPWSASGMVLNNTAETSILIVVMKRQPGAKNKKPETKKKSATAKAIPQGVRDFLGDELHLFKRDDA